MGPKSVLDGFRRGVQRVRVSNIACKANGLAVHVHNRRARRVGREPLALDVLRVVEAPPTCPRHAKGDSRNNQNDQAGNNQALSKSSALGRAILSGVTLRGVLFRGSALLASFALDVRATTGVLNARKRGVELEFATATWGFFGFGGHSGISCRGSLRFAARRALAIGGLRIAFAWCGSAWQISRMRSVIYEIGSRNSGFGFGHRNACDLGNRDHIGHTRSRGRPLCRPRCFYRPDRPFKTISGP